MINYRRLLEEANSAVDGFDVEGLRELGLLPRNDLFVFSTYYPPLTQYPQSTGEEMLKGFERDRWENFSLYLHIPQCPVRCTYCHWVVSLQNSAADMDHYLDHLEKEMDMWRARFGGRRPAPSSILVGGGTPTLLPPPQMKRFLRAVTSRFDLSRCRQFSVEAEPATMLGPIGAERLKLLKDFGVDRISMGVQSFDDDVLKYMGRPHDSREAQEAIRQIRKAGIGSVSIDLIYGFPGYTPEKWIDTLETALSLDIDAYQLYRLRILPHGDKAGAVRDWHEKKPEIFPSLREIHVMKMLGKIVSREHGFGENLRRIYSRSPKHVSFYIRDYACRLYDILGMGISSWSNLGDRTLLNTGASLKHYYSLIDEGRLPVDRGLKQSADVRRRKAVILPLKNFGVSKSRYREFAGADLSRVFGPRLRALEQHGLLKEDAGKVVLTEKGGFFSDEVVMRFYDPERIPFPRSNYSDGELAPH
jgi:oxygen-independent coproporphyrinogen-3 oxidase